MLKFFFIVELIAKQPNTYFNLPLSYLPHTAIQPNYTNNSFYSSPPHKRKQAETTSDSQSNNITNNKDEQLPCNDCYYLNEIINFKL